MEAARVAALRGHRVVLFEAESELGGKLIVASKPEFKKDLKRFLDYLKHQLVETSVEVRLNTPAVPELIAQTNPDVLTST